MQEDNTLEKIAEKFICFQCVEEEYFSEEIGRDGTLEVCSYCNKNLNCYSIADVADRVEDAFKRHYVRTSDQPDTYEYRLMADRELNYSWDRHGTPVVDAIAQAGEIPDEAASDIQKILEDRNYDHHSWEVDEETEFAAASHYEELGIGDEAWQEEWREFEKSLKTEARFFNQRASRHLEAVFKDIANLTTSHGQPVIIDAGPDFPLKAIFRARVFQSDDVLVEALCRPDLFIGPPSMKLANAGRMNARGISVFYGANSSDVAIAEVRPPVGGQVTVAEFEFIRALRFLDLTALSNIRESGSIFDPSFADRLARAEFLRFLSDRISQAVMPNDEVFEYLPTQAIADYLGSSSDLNLDGITFRSVQAGRDGINIVLFHKSSRVEEIDLPDGTILSASVGSSDEDGWQRDYSVWEDVPLTPAKVDIEPTAEFGFFDFSSGFPTEPGDPRAASLRVNLKSVRVHVVQSVQFSCEEFEVSRYRREGRRKY